MPRCKRIPKYARRTSGRPSACDGMLTIRGLSAGYEGAGDVLRGIDLDLGPGERVALMGRNGMGKTTLLRAIMGHVRNRSGRLALDGVDLAGRPPFAVSNAGIAYVPQGREIFNDFTVEENLRLGLLGKIGMRARVPEAIFARFPMLGERRSQVAGSMSGVEQRGGSFWLALVLAPLALALIGVLIEEVVIRHVYRRFIDTILATWGLSIGLKQAVIVGFGATAQQVPNPLPQAVRVLGTLYPLYRLFVMAVAVLAAAATFLLFYRTSLGLAARAVIANRSMASSLGLNTRRMDRMTFAFGAALAGLAGAVMAPLMSVDPQMGVGFLIPAFLSILVGGAGSLLGALLGTTLIGAASTLVSSVWTQTVAEITVFGLAIVVIRLFPRGLTGARR